MGEERTDARRLEEKAEQLRHEADRLGEMVEALNETMGRNLLKSWLFALFNTAILLPVIGLGAYLGFRTALKHATRERKRSPLRGY